MTQDNSLKSSGPKYTKALFFEMTTPDNRAVCRYTLKDHDHNGYLSLYRLYMETDDPTEWEFANKYLDGWEHFELLCSLSWFKPLITRWRKELELRMKSRALARIIRESKTNSREAFVANRYILEKGWEPKAESKRGRPSKDEIKEAAKQEANALFRLDQDLERITNKDLN